MLGKLAKQSATYGVSTILGRLLSYLLTPYYTRLFSPSEYGVITDIYALIPFALVVLMMGMESSYFRFSAKAENESAKERLFATAWGSTIIASLIFVAAVVLFQNPISRAMGEAYTAHPQMVTLVALIILFDISATIPFAKLREQGESGKYVLLKLLNIILQVSFAIIFGAMGLFGSEFGVGWVLVANLAASILTLLATLMAVGVVTPRIEWSLLGAILLYSFPLLVSGVAGTATDFIDRQLIKYIAPVEAMAQLGIYGAVTKIAVVMTLFTQMYRLAAEPFFLSEFKHDEFVESNAAAMKYYIIFTIAIFLGITLFQDLFALIVGSQFREGVYILPVVLMSNLLMGVWLNLSFWYKRVEKTHFALYVTFAGLAATVVANLYMIPLWGYAGAAWARLMSQVVMVAVSYYLCCRHFPIPYELGRMAQYIVLGVALYYASVELHRMIEPQMVMWIVNILLLGIYSWYAVWREEIDLKGLVNRALKRG